MITINKLQKIENNFTAGTLKDLELLLGFELNNGHDSSDYDTPNNMIDMYYKIEAIDDDGDAAQVTIFLTYEAEFKDETNDGIKYKVPIDQENWKINRARMTFDIDYI